MSTAFFATPLSLGLGLAMVSSAALQDCESGDPHSHPDLHACHHVVMGANPVRASADPDAAPSISTTQESHGHYTVMLPRDGVGSGGYVRFHGLQDDDVYVLYWTEPSLEVTLYDAATGAEIAPIVYSESIVECDEIVGRLEFPVEGVDYQILLTSRSSDATDVVLEAWSQY